MQISYGYRCLLLLVYSLKWPATCVRLVGNSRTKCTFTRHRGIKNLRVFNFNAYTWRKWSTYMKYLCLACHIKCTLFWRKTIRHVHLIFFKTTVSLDYCLYFTGIVPHTRWYFMDGILFATLAILWWKETRASPWNSWCILNRGRPRPANMTKADNHSTHMCHFGNPLKLVHGQAQQ